MSLNFASTDNVVTTDSSSIQNLTAFSCLFWIYPTSDTGQNRKLYTKSAGSFPKVFRFHNSNNARNVHFQIPRTTTEANFAVALSVNDVLTANEWQFYAGTYDDSGSDAASTINIYRGLLNSTAAEVTYATHNAGSGSTENDSGNDLFYGASAVNQTLLGYCAIFALVARYLSLQEVISWQWNPRVIADTRIFQIYGYNGTSTQPDWSGNGNSGTVTGATVAGHVPLRPPFGGIAGWRGAYTAPAAASTNPSRLLLMGVG